MLEYALKYAELGWSVIPLVPKGKVPLKRVTWKKYQMKRATPDKISEWWRLNPEANIGVVTGKISGICVVDLDGPNAVHLLESQVCPFPETIFQATGRSEGGKHAFFKCPSNGKSLKTKPGYLEGVDLKAVGGYVVVSPSIDVNPSHPIDIANILLINLEYNKFNFDEFVKSLRSCHCERSEAISINLSR
jgi:hypothetical protein